MPGTFIKGPELIDSIHPQRMINLISAFILIAFGLVFKSGNYFAIICGVLSLISFFSKSEDTEKAINFLLGVVFLSIFCVLFVFQFNAIEWLIYSFLGLNTKYLLFYLFFAVLFLFNSTRRVHHKM